MNITKFETTHPVSIALLTAFESGLIDQDREKVLNDELRELVTESAQKFVNIKSIKAIREALDITLGILSLSIVHTTKGKTDPHRWAQVICEDGFKKTVGIIIPHVKEVAQKIEQGLNEDVGANFTSVDARKCLLDFAINRKKGRWNGYDKMSSSLHTATENIKSLELVKWLILSLTKTPFEKWLAINEDPELKGVFPLIEHTRNNLLFRHCANLRITSKLVLSTKEFQSARARYEQDQKKWLVEARRRYDTLVTQMPEEFRSTLVQTTASSKKKKDWFERMLAKGPPSVPKDKYLDPTGDFAAYQV